MILALSLYKHFYSSFNIYGASLSQALYYTYITSVHLQSDPEGKVSFSLFYSRG